MSRRIFLAGAAGAIGRPLCGLLLADGWQVKGTTRSAERAEELHALGVEPAVVDVFDATGLAEAMAAARPDVVMHQLTDLPFGLDPAKMSDARARNARLREAGTANLVASAVAAGAGRFVAQSVAFVYAPGLTPYEETAPLNIDAPGDAGLSARGVASLEQQVLTAPLTGVVLRYAMIYGPGTGFDAAPISGSVHVHAAADAARRALTHGTGIYNIAEAGGPVSIAKATAELGWTPNFRMQPRSVASS
jgi:nucleoside-diphosphate-sugar epimerase